MAPGLPVFRLHIALAMISAAVIAFQLALMQVLSLVQWHHFASMIIAVALLGFGWSRGWPRAHGSVSIPC
jgi:hypothetical protein